MNQEKINIGVFVASAKMADRVKRYAAMQDDITITIAQKTSQKNSSESEEHLVYMGLEEAIPVGEKMVKDGVEVIISRRGTAHVLRENLEVSVLSFPTTDFDLILGLKKASGMGKRIFLPVFRNKLTDIDEIFTLLKIDVIQKAYADTNSLEEAIIRARAQGCDVVVGGPMTAAFARENGMKAVELETSDDVIAATIEDAKSVAKSNRKERETARRYHTIINTASDGIIAYDLQGQVNTVNAKARTLLGLSDSITSPCHISEIMNSTPSLEILHTGKPILDSIETINGSSLVLNHTPVWLDEAVVGGVTTFNDIDGVMKSENKVRKNLAKGLVAKYSIEDLIFQSEKMAKAVERCRLYAKTHSTILITGETGTGKEIFAHSIHNLSQRAKMPFVSINCAALPEQLLESELFGYEEGAFTGSKKGGKPGLFELAHNGTIFLDEISAAPKSVQVRLLRVLQEKEVMRLGSDRLIPVDVRVVAAANQELSAEVQEGNFREDLYFRLNILRVNLPGLRNRQEDIPRLAEHFITSYSAKRDFRPITIPPKYLDALVQYSWPGNIRQFRNFIVRLTLLCDSEFSPEVFAELYEELMEFQPTGQPAHHWQSSGSLQEELKRRQEDNEAEIIRTALRESNFRKNIAAKKLGMSRTTLWRKMAELGLEETL